MLLNDINHDRATHTPDTIEGANLRPESQTRRARRHTASTSYCRDHTAAARWAAVCGPLFYVFELIVFHSQRPRMHVVMRPDSAMCGIHDTCMCMPTWFIQDMWDRGRGPGERQFSILLLSAFASNLLQTCAMCSMLLVSIWCVVWRCDWIIQQPGCPARSRKRRKGVERSVGECRWARVPFSCHVVLCSVCTFSESGQVYSMNVRKSLFVLLICSMLQPLHLDNIQPIHFKDALALLCWIHSGNCAGIRSTNFTQVEQGTMETFNQELRWSFTMPYRAGLLLQKVINAEVVWDMLRCYHPDCTPDECYAPWHIYTHYVSAFCDKRLRSLLQKRVKYLNNYVWYIDFYSR